MKLTPIQRALFVSAPALLALGVHAIAKPDAEKVKQTAETKLVVPDKTGDIVTKVGGKKAVRVAVAEQFRLWLSVNATECNDPLFPGETGDDDHQFEAYGELKVNGKSHWKVNREFAHQFRIKRLDLPKPLEVDPRKQGFTLNANPQIFMDKHEIAFDTQADGRIANIVLKLTDKDDPNADTMDAAAQRRADKKDDLIGDYKIAVDLSQLGARDGRYYWTWSGKDGSGNAVGTTIYLFVEHVKTIYGTGQMRKPVIEPKIVEKKTPGKVGGPGPLISTPVKGKVAPAKAK